MPPEAATTVAEVIRGRAGDTHTGLVFEGESWTWAEVVTEMSARAGWLKSLTTGRPPHVGVLLDNVPGFLFTLGATMLSGSVLVGLNSTRRGAELATDIRHTDCAVIVTDAEHASLLDGLDLGGAIVVDVDDAPPASGTDEPGASAPSADDLGLLLFTAGSTGTPKAVRVTQGRMARSAAGFGFSADDVLYCAMPLFHGNALFSSVIPAMGCGATIVLRRRFSASETMPDIRAASATFFATIGRALSFIVGTPADPEDRHHHLRFVLAPESSPSDMAAFEARFGCPVFSGYGSSENAVIFVPRPGLPPDALGVPQKGLDVAIIDPETGEECEPARFDGSGRMVNAGAATGEIVGRNALERFEGYYKNPEATRERSRGGWYWSGDLGYRDEEGIFYFAGRTIDWLRVDGENFASAPVERLLLRFEGVTGAAVFGVPDERTADDQVMAVLEMADPTGFDPAAFDRFLADQADLGTKWTPRYVRVMERLPVVATNKIDKRPLRETGWRVDGPVYWRPDRRQPLRPLSADDAGGLEASFGRHRQRR
ncbi:MAG TPA: AMP-binding protein [Acidimicrobiales bacterium]|nr:AMP-binding protein [Acidimicrobiales bacterium]